MERNAIPTGDVVKDWSIREDEKIYFLLRSGENTFTMGLGDLLDCLRFAEKEERYRSFLQSGGEGYGVCIHRFRN